MALLHYMDTILVPLSFFMTFGYHAYLWYQFKTKPSCTTIGIESIKRKHWLKDMRQGDDKNATLAVQSLRNTLMSSILVAMVSSIITVALTALINNTSMAVATLIDANYLVYALGAEPESDRATSPSPSPSSSRKYTRDILERGFVLAIFGNRMLCITFPVLFWLVSPVVFVFASVEAKSKLLEAAKLHVHIGLNTYLGKINTRVPISSYELSTLNSASSVVLEENWVSHR
ncbi:extensin like protein [Tanacetum coccineum]